MATTTKETPQENLQDNLPFGATTEQAATQTQAQVQTPQAAAPQAQTPTVAAPVQAVASKPSDAAIATISSYIEKGLVLPQNYNYVNAIRASIMTIAEMRDRDGKTPFETCTKVSIQSSLVEMAQKGLDASKGQCSFIKRGNRLTLQEIYHGVKTQLQRMFPNYTPNPRVIYAGDEFEYETDPTTGRRRLVKHVQKLENLDNDFVGAYLYTPCNDGGTDLYIMTKKMIEEAWKQSSNAGLPVHHRYTDKMVCKTIINSALLPIVKASDSTKDDIPETAEEERDYTTATQANVKVIDTDKVEYQNADVVDEPY